MTVEATQIEEVGGSTLDWSRLPAIVVQPPKRPVSDAELQALLDRFWEVAKTQPRYGLVLDLSASAPLDPRQRAMLVEQMQAAEGELATDCAATALIFRSPLMRGLLTATLWLWRPPYRTRTFATAAQGVSWVHSLIGLAQTG